MSQVMKQIAIGYLLLHINFNFGTLNILPDWLGYLFILRALAGLAEEEPSAKLLQPLGKILLAWEVIEWTVVLFGGEFAGYGISIIVIAVSLYFNFQLLTNLANIAEKYDCPERNKILFLRTILTVMNTMFALPFPWEEYQGITIVFIVINLVVTLWMCILLFSLKRSLEKQASSTRKLDFA